MATDGADSGIHSSSSTISNTPVQDIFRTVRLFTYREPVQVSAVQRISNWLGFEQEREFESNEISTAKYTPLTFLPQNLFEQFCRVANFYFLFIAALQLIPGLSPTSWFTTVFPLVLVLTVNAVKEGYEDYHRHKNDDEINSRKVTVLREHGSSGALQKVDTLWKELQVGDMVLVGSDEEVPADLLFLSSSDPENLCYVETANLDGETNLKIKYCYSKTAGWKPERDGPQYVELTKDHIVHCELPNARLYVFEGYVEGPGGSKDALDASNLLLRGCTLRKTDWIVGAVIFTGRDTKIVRNNIPSPRKITQLERHMNILVLLMFSIQLLFSVLLAAGDNIISKNIEKHYYLSHSDEWPDLAPGVAAFFVQVLRFIILLNQMIPISLYVTLEIVKVLQCVMLNADLEMYFEETDTPFACRTTSLNEELGQVEYVLSDKTGTLTQNVMGFVRASIAGQVYGLHPNYAGVPPGFPRNTPHSIILDNELHRALGITGTPTSVDPAVRDFFVNLAICNTVVPALGEGELPIYQASSPDEEALVQGAAYLGVKLLSRSTDRIEVEVASQLMAFEVLAVLEFNSDRKRMSVICRNENTNEIMLYCKGADTKILSLVDETNPLIPRVKAHLDDMASGGYRTLAIAQRKLTAKEYQDWNEEFAMASVALQDRELEIARVAEKIEQRLTLLGATAVEDKLQDGVPEAIKHLGDAGIKVWVLTGDKVETAISIAMSCQLFNNDMHLIELREEDLPQGKGNHIEDYRQRLHSRLQEAVNVNHSRGQMVTGLVVDGAALQVALEPSLQDAFMKLCKHCRAVVCCRVSPMQKALVTNMVKKKAGAVTLGIGDGANDVGMIKNAHIGCGISGREGRAAVLSSDFAFAQFRYLARLLLVHGRWSYKRNREVVLYAFYKNWAYCLPYVYLQFVAAYSSQPIYTSPLISTFNVIWTSLPIAVFALLEQDVSAKTVMANPKLYLETMLENVRSFFKSLVKWLIEASWHSVVVFCLPLFVMSRPDINGRSDGLVHIGTTVYTAVIIVVNLKVALRTRYWTHWNWTLMFLVSIGLWFPFLYALSALWGKFKIAAVAEDDHLAQDLFGSPRYWLTGILGAPAISILLDLTIMAFQRTYFPQPYQIFQEKEYLDNAAKKRRGPDNQPLQSEVALADV